MEILRDRWGVPHIYAKNTEDLFFANGYHQRERPSVPDRSLAPDVGTGKLAEVLGPQYLRRDRMARLFHYRGDWNAEWQSYSPDAKQIMAAFTTGINAYIKSLNGSRPTEFQAAGYDPGLWMPEDCLARIAGLATSRNVSQEIVHAAGCHRLRSRSPSSNRSRPDPTASHCHPASSCRTSPMRSSWNSTRCRPSRRSVRAATTGPSTAPAPLPESP